MSSRRTFALLALAATAYAIAAWSVAPGFFDGIAPPSPYRWVSPPAQFKGSNQQPLAGHGSASVASNGVVNPGTVFTQDGQASVSFVPGAFVAPSGGSAVNIDIKPVETFPKASGLTLQTNVYCFTSSSPLASGKDVLISLRYSNGIPAPTNVYAYQGSGPWRNLGSTGSAAPFTISARSTFLGCYAAGYPANVQNAQGARVGGGQALPVIVALAILLVILAGIPLAVLRRRGQHEDEDGEEGEEGADGSG